jgi:hypothetical protein
VFFNGQIQPNFSLVFSFPLFGRQRVANAQSRGAPIRRASNRHPEQAAEPEYQFQFEAEGRNPERN